MAYVEVKRYEWSIGKKKMVAYRGRIFSDFRRMTVYESEYYSKRSEAMADAKLIFEACAEPAVKLYDAKGVEIVPLGEALRRLRAGELALKITRDELKRRQYRDVFRTTRDIDEYVRKLQRRELRYMLSCVETGCG